MFNLNELIIVRDALSTKIADMHGQQEQVKRKDLEALMGENLTRVITLYGKVSKQVRVMACFDSDATGGVKNHEQI